MAPRPTFSEPADDSPVTRPITVLIVDPNELNRAGLRTILSSDPRFELVGETRPDDVGAVEHHQPELIILDPAAHGVIDRALIRELHQHCATSRLVVLTTTFAVLYGNYA
jgi:two-component system response regulator DevR